jgi:glycosyltransferase involved in cell wall biosynthesis
MRGGGQRSMYLLIKYLDRSRYTPFLVMPEEGELTEEVRKLGVKIYAILLPRVRSLNIFKVIAALLKLMICIRDNSIDLIHVDAPREAIFAGIAGKLLGVPVVCHLRVSDSEIWLDKILYRLADCFIAVSHAVARRFSSIDKKSKVHVVYNGVELDTCSMRLGRSKSSCLRIGYFGRIDRRKGIDTLVNAVRVLKDNVELLIMGDGDEAYLTELKKMAIGTDAIFREYKPDVRNDMSLVDVVVLPSYYGEGLSRVIIEAMALGKIVIVSDLPENREVLGAQLEQFVFPVGKSKELAAKLKGIIENNAILDEKKPVLSKRAEEHFDIRENTRQTESIYDRLIRK